MLVKLTSKGQLVIPKPIRDTLGLASGDQFEVRLVDDKIVLEPLSGRNLIASLYGRYSGEDFIEDLEEEHSQEMAGE